MSEVVRRRVDSAPDHLPPLELLPYVTHRAGHNVALQRFETPLDENDVPDVRKLLERLGSKITYSSDYEEQINLSIANRHHAVHRKSIYWQHGRQSFQVKHRELTDVKIDLYIPFHNLEHLIGLEPPMSKPEVMRQRAIERDQVVRLYRLGSAAVWLDEMRHDGEQGYTTAEAYILRHGLRGIKNDEFGKRMLPSHGTFLEYLEHCRPGELGVMPNIEMLGTMELTDAVHELGKIAARGAAISVEESTAIIMEASRKATGYDHPLPAEERAAA